MAEFGENLKNVREQKGYTQQTLADHLYVTRQAVSRWEGGSRYPDLMTAKKMAQFLEVSLDELLTDDDMKLYAEKNAIIENPTAKRGQLILLALAFMSMLFLSIIQLTNFYFEDGKVLVKSTLGWTEVEGLTSTEWKASEDMVQTNTLAKVLKIELSNISIKAKTKEKLDAVGESKAIEANAVVLLVTK